MTPKRKEVSRFILSRSQYKELRNLIVHEFLFLQWSSFGKPLGNIFREVGQDGRGTGSLEA